jgi:8-oxo-dGTP diphosphatase
MKHRSSRCQGAILRDDHILLIQHREHQSGRSYWLLPGSGIEDGETDAQCVRREMQEETGLEVQVERLLMITLGPSGRTERKTYLCRLLAGEARPGYEPEPTASEIYGIVAVRWVDLRDETTWGMEIQADPFTYPELRRIQSLLGYISR